MTPPFDTSVAPKRGGGLGGGVFLVTATLLLASGCATKGDVRSLQDEVAAQAIRQESQLRELSRDVQALQDSLQLQSVVQSEMVVDTRGGIARELRDIQAQLSQLTALTGQIQRVVATLSERLQAQGARVTTSPTRADPDSIGALIRRGGGDPAAAADMYDQAVRQFNSGEYNIARMVFSRLLGDYPRDPLAPRARFYLGQILEEEDRLDEAIEEFLRVRELHPASAEAPVALYRIGLIYVRQEDVDTAESYLERVVNSYPESDAAGLAQDELERIR